MLFFPYGEDGWRVGGDRMPEHTNHFTVILA